jgi:hypothetical protein
LWQLLIKLWQILTTILRERDLLGLVGLQHMLGKAVRVTQTKWAALLLVYGHITLLVVIT